MVADLRLETRIAHRRRKFAEQCADVVVLRMADVGAAFVRDYDWALVARRLETIYAALVSKAGLKGPPYIGHAGASVQM